MSRHHNKKRFILMKKSRRAFFESPTFNIAFKLKASTKYFFDEKEK